MTCRRENAFTLVEVLATLALIAIILPVAMRGIALATAVGGQARRQTEATALAESKLAELRATGDWESSALSGDFAPDWPEYRWTAEVKDWDGVIVRELAVAVGWTAQNKPHQVKLATLVYSGTD